MAVISPCRANSTDSPTSHQSIAQAVCTISTVWTRTMWYDTLLSLDHRMALQTPTIPAETQLYRCNLRLGQRPLHSLQHQGQCLENCPLWLCHHALESTKDKVPKPSPFGKGIPCRQSQVGSHKQTIDKEQQDHSMGSLEACSHSCSVPYRSAVRCNCTPGHTTPYLLTHNSSCLCHGLQLHRCRQ